MSLPCKCGCHAPPLPDPRTPAAVIHLLTPPAPSPRRPWMRTHAGRGLSSSYPGDHAIPLLLISPTLSNPPPPSLLAHSSPPPDYGAERLLGPRSIYNTLTLHALGHGLSLQRGFGNDVCVLMEKNGGEQVTGKCGGNLRDHVGLGRPQQTLRKEEGLAGPCLGYTVTNMKLPPGGARRAPEGGVQWHHLADPASGFYGETVDLSLAKKETGAQKG